MARSPLDAYKAVQEESLSGRALEAHVLLKAVARLEACQSQWEEPGQFERLDDALRYNQRLWSLFQVEILKADNPLPRNLKQDLLNLAGFIDKRTFQTMAYPDKSKLDILITINRNVAEGLLTNPG